MATKAKQYVPGKQNSSTTQVHGFPTHSKGMTMPKSRQGNPKQVAKARSK